MSHTETRSTVFARPVIDRRDMRIDGLSGDEPAYGRIQIIRSTVTEEVTDGDRSRVLRSEQTEEVVLDDLDATAAAHLMSTMTTALADSLRVRGGAR